VAAEGTSSEQAAGAEKPTPAVGPFGEALYANLQEAPEGTAPDQIVMQTLRGVPLADLKAALAKATPKERGQVFSVLPADQIASSLLALPAEFLAPATPPPPLPAPAGGPPASILMTTYENVAYPPAQQDPLWAQKITGGATVGLDGGVEWLSVYDHRFEKEGSLNNPMAGLTGWAIQGDPPISTADVCLFTHSETTSSTTSPRIPSTRSCAEGRTPASTQTMATSTRSTTRQLKSPDPERRTLMGRSSGKDSG
jgi:hypothetical protein